MATMHNKAARKKIIMFALLQLERKKNAVKINVIGVSYSAYDPSNIIT